MPLSQLLAHLSPEDRAVLLERRLGPNAVAIDDAALASQLAQPASLAPALAQLNSAQLLLLRWLAGRPNLRAEWSELLGALGDRLAPELRDAYLNDLRQWGVADYDPDECGGFVATYPAVAANLPHRRGIRLRQRLEGLNSDVVLKLGGALGLKNLPTRKDGRIQAILDTLTHPERCRAAVEALPGPARELFEWVRERGGWVGVAEMSERVPPRGGTYGYGYGGPYGTMDSYWRSDPAKGDADPLDALMRRGLVLPLTPYPGGWYAPSAFAVTDEVELTYSGRTLFDTGPLQPPRLEPADGVSGGVPSPANLLRDVGHLLGFIGTGRCEWRQDNQPYKRSLVALGKLLGHPNGDYAESLWELAAAAGLVRPARRGRPGYEPVAVGELSPLQLLDRLLIGWIDAGSQTVLYGVTHFSIRNARLYLLQLMRAMPPDTWVLKSSVEAWLRFNWPVVFAPEYRREDGGQPDAGWASMGIMLLGHGSTPAGADAVMLPAAHQRLLVPAERADADALLPWDDTWIVQADRSVLAPPNAHPEALMDLWQVAQLESNQGASQFRVSADSIAAALNRGLKPAEIRKRLETRSKVSLPPTVERLVGDQEQRYGRIKVGTARTYVRADEPALLEELRRNSKLRGLDFQEVAPGVAFVGGSDPNAVLETLRRAGYLPVLDEAKKSGPKKAGGPSAAGDSGRRRAGSGATSLTSMVRQAIREDRLLTATWVERGREKTGELEPLDLHGREIHANNLEDGEEVLVPLDAILGLELGEPLDALDDYDDDEEPTW